MVTQSPDIASINFEVLVDISVPVPVVTFHNLSVGSNLDGCAWIVGVRAGGIPVHIGNLSTPDITGSWVDYTLPETLPQPGRNIIWGEYEFTLTVKDSVGSQFTETHLASIKRPNGNQNGSNYGKASFDIVARCDEAKLYVEDRTNVSYKNSARPYLPISQTFTLAFPASEQGTVPPPKVIISFSNALIPISVSGPGYVGILEVVAQYEMGDNVFLQIKYRHKEPFAVSCHVDLCQLQCAYDSLVKKAEDNCDSELRNKLLIVNAKINQAIMGKLQPLCGVDVGKLIEEIKAIGGFDCDCNCDNGINPLITTAGSTVDCAAVLECLDTLLCQVDVKCLTTSDIEWCSLSLLGKFQLLFNTVTAPICDTCTAPTDVAFDPATNILTWTDTANSPMWRIEYKQSTDNAYTLYTTTAPTQVNATQWQLDLSGFTFVANVAYLFRVAGQCGNGSYSPYTTTSSVIAVACYTITQITGELTQ